MDEYIRFGAEKEFSGRLRCRQVMRCSQSLYALLFRSMAALDQCDAAVVLEKPHVASASQVLVFMVVAAR